MLRSPLRSACFALVVASLPACRTAPAPAEPEAPGQERQAAKALAPAPELEAIEAAKHPMELLPADTLLSMEVRGVGRLFRELGVPDALTQGGQLGAMAQVMLDEVSRGIVEDPNRLREFGIDPDGSAGMAILDVPAKSIAFWMTVSDRERLQQEFETRSGERLRFGGTRAAEIAAMGEDTRVVLRDGFLFIINTERADLANRDIARALADSQPREGLWHQDAYEQAVAGREAAVSLLYTRPGALMKAFVQDEAPQRERVASRMGELQWLIEEARGQGASSADLVSLETEWQTVSRDASEGTQRDAAVWQQVHAMVQPIDSLSIAIGIKAGELRGDVRASVPNPRALVHRIFTELSGPSPQAAALNVTPGGLYEMAVDPTEVESVIEAFMLADRQDPDRLDAEMRAETGISWRTDILGHMTGAGGGGVFFARPPSFKQGRRLDDQLDFVGYLGIKDPKAVEQSLARFTKSPKVKKELKPKKIGGGWSFRLDDEHTAYVVVGASQILATSDADVARRFVNGTAGGGLGMMPAPQPRGDFETKGLAGRSMFNLLLGFALEARGASTRSLESFDYRFNWYREVPPEKLKTIRMGSAVKKSALSWPSSTASTTPRLSAFGKRSGRLTWPWLSASATCMPVSVSNARPLKARWSGASSR